MKKNFSFFALVATLATIIVTNLSSCSSMEEDGTGYPLRLNVVIEATSEIPKNALTQNSPCHVVAFIRDKACSPFYYLFEDNAYVSDGQLVWTGKYRYWPGKYTKFIAYWPATASVEFDDRGNVISSDATLIAISEPMCHFTENPTLTFEVRDSYQ